MKQLSVQKSKARTTRVARRYDSIFVRDYTNVWNTKTTVRDSISWAYLLQAMPVPRGGRPVKNLNTVGQPICVGHKCADYFCATLVTNVNSIIVLPFNICIVGLLHLYLCTTRTKFTRFTILIFDSNLWSFLDLIRSPSQDDWRATGSAAGCWYRRDHPMTILWDHPIMYDRPWNITQETLPTIFAKSVPAVS